MSSTLLPTNAHPFPPGSPGPYSSSLLANGTDDDDMEIRKAALEWSPARGNDVAGRNGASEAGRHGHIKVASVSCLSSYYSTPAYPKKRKKKQRDRRV
jgi:hypothetical protein